MMESMGMKRIGLIAAVAASSALMWWATHGWLATEGRFADWRLFVWPLLAVALMGAVTGLAMALLTSRWDRFAATVAAWATLPIFFPPNVWFITVLPVFAFLWLDGSRRIQRELQERHRIRVRGVLGSGLKLILLGVFLMVSLGFYLTPTGSSVDVASVSRGIQSSLESSYDLPVVRDQLADLPPSLQSQFKRDLAAGVDEYVTAWLGPIAHLIPPLLALALFLGLWGLHGLIREPVLWLAQGAFVLMRRTGFAVIGQEQVAKETLSLE